MFKRLEGRRALVTGAGRGIGRAIALAFAREGASVAALDREEDPVREVCSEIGGHPIVFDLARTRDLEGLAQRVEREFGPLDVLVNCAGICLTRPMDEIDEASWRAVFDVNVHAAFFLTRAVARSMKARGRGSVINLASVSGFLPKLEQIDYGASKAALVSITRSCALALGPSGVRVNAIAPGVIDTPLTQQIAEQRAEIRGVTPEATLEPVLQATPLRRVGTAEEVADMAVFLASDESAYVTGQTFNVDGGFLMR